jgi:hypothetical protein
MKDQLVALLNFHGVYDPTVVKNPSRLQSVAKHLKQEMDDAKAVRRAALDAERACKEARQHENMHQDGALGALPQGYGVKAPCVAGADEERLRCNQDVCNLLAQNPRLQNDHLCPIIFADVLPCPQAEAGAVCAGTVVTPISVCTVEEGAIHPPAAVFQLGEQQATPPQLPTLGEFTAMTVPPLAPNAEAWLPAAPGQVGTANNAACKAAVAAQRFVANSATAGVGAPIVVDEADAAVMRHPCHLNNMEVIDGINRTILQLTSMIGEALKVRGEMAVAVGGTGGAAAANCKLELLLKQCKLAIEVGNQLLIAHCEKMICMLEEMEAKEIEGGSL